MEQYEWMLPTERSVVSDIESLLRSVPAVEELSPERRFNAIVAAMEAITNAVIHGNRSDGSKKIKLRVEVHDDEIRIYVRDYGSGFDPDVLPDPRLKENLLREGGRGVFLMRSLVDDVAFVPDEPGTEVILTIKRY
ncbi:MAG: ATP-binding protein [Chlorobi bacterium]|nr:ATP-binding protein [Chlorobiota bacterium]